MVELKTLTAIGLSDKEAKVYLALMELGTGTVIEVARKAGVKRPTAYLVLDGLANKELAIKVPKEIGLSYAAVDPAELERRMKERLVGFSQMLPYLRAKFNRGTKPRITFYEGRDAISNLYVREIFPEERIYFFGTSIGKLKKTLPDVLNIWERQWQRKKRVENILEIVSNESEDVAYAKEVSKLRNTRIIPKGKQFLSDSVIAGDKILIVSLENLFAVMIQSHDLAETYRTLVELAWQSAIPASEWKDG